LVGIIMTVLVLSFLAVVLYSGISLVTTEIKAQNASQYPDQARAAAMSGIQFYLGCLVIASDTTFATTATQRLHFLSESNRNNTAVAGQQVATWTGSLPSPKIFSNIATSSWMYPITLNLSPSGALDIPSSTVFILKTYVHDDGGPNLASYVYVKSLGCYREIQGNEVVASYYAQLLARILIASAEQEVSLEKYRSMPVQYPSGPTSPFHTNLPRPW
jgi:hypothetical protein